MLVTIKLYGHLGKKFGHEFQFDIDTISESIKALSANLPEFREYLINNSQPGYRIKVDDRPIMSMEEIGLCANEGSVIRIIPVVIGAGDGKSIGMIIVGVVLVVAAFFTMGQSLWGFTVTPAIAGAAMSLGAGMALSGASALLSPVPVISPGAKQSNNLGFSNVPRTASQGYRVPICYGRNMLEGIPISVKLVIQHA